MRLITKLGFVSLLLAFSMMLYSCVDEPTITPVPIPYTSLRVGNFASNVATMTIAIDGKAVGTFAANQISNRFDITSGARQVVITDGAGNKIFDKSVTAISYEEETWMFTGYYSDQDTSNSFGFNLISEGVVYLNEAPAADSAWVNLINLVADTPTEISKEIKYFFAPADTSISRDTLQGFFKFGVGNKAGSQLRSQKYYYTFTDTASAFSVNDSLNVDSGMRYYLYVSGTQSNFKLITDEQAPLPIRSK